MEALTPIPTPRGQRWREFRIQVLPGITFLGILIAVVFLWRNFVQPVGVVGEVEAVTANVTSLGDGLLAELTVDRFETVTRGQALGRVVQSDPDFIKASLGAIETDLRLLKARMDLDRTRNLESHSRLKLDLMSEQIALNLAQIRSVQVSNEFRRATYLHEQGIIPAGEGIGVGPAQRDVAGYDVSLRDWQAVQKEVADRASLVKQWEEELQKMESQGVYQIDAQDSLVDEAIKAKELELQLTLKPTVLKAPIDGVVGLVYRRAGEKVVRGEVILTINAAKSERIVAYIRQPIPSILPTTNDTVQVRTRNLRRQIAQAQILRVGSQMEPINPALISTDSNRIEVGLPMLVSLPPGLRLMPGEFVDLSILYSRK